MDQTGLKGFLYLELLITAFLAGLILLIAFSWQQRFYNANQKTRTYYQQKEKIVNTIESDTGQVKYTTGNITVKNAEGIMYLQVN